MTCPLFPTNELYNLTYDCTPIVVFNLANYSFQMSVRVQECVWNPAPSWMAGLVDQGPRGSKIGRLEPGG